MKFDEIQIRVRYGETDQMGVVHHGNYALYLELARTEWLRALGISYKEMEEQGIMLPVVSMSLNYKKSAFYDDVLTVKTILKKKPGVRIDFDFEITNEAGELIVLANTVLAFMDMNTKRPIRCPKSILDLMPE
ncbi:acyl-CoA thioesterase [Formosa sp. S-31]|uniref:acyl-CoA thioesterase n=1 Tax=Formosa sp. S-31 TaxID=2790949 RepID=UPI003EB83596